MPGEVEGLDRFTATLSDAADQLGDMDGASRAVGSMVVNVASRLAPKRTGALAASVSAVTTVANVVDVRAGTAYAGPIHWGWPAHGITAQPFIQDAIRMNEDDIVELYADEVVEILGTVKGD
jgi:hypothetical protein